MATKIELLLEAEKRGLLPADKIAALNEARRRGLVAGVESPKFEQARESYTKYAGAPVAAAGQEAPMPIARPGAPSGLPSGAGVVVEETPKEETTLAGLAGAVTRGIAPAALGAAGGGLLGGVVGGLAAGPAGVIPGAQLGAELGGGAMTIGQLPIAPLVDIANRALGTNIQQPTQALEALLTEAGVAEPKTAVERITQMLASGAAGTAGTAQAAAATPRVVASPVARSVAAGIAAEQGAQTVSGAASGAASQLAAELGLGYGGQLVAGIIAGGAGMAAGRKAIPSQATAAEQAASFRGVPAEVPPEMPMPPVTSAQAEAQAARLTGTAGPRVTSAEAEAQADRMIKAMRAARGETPAPKAAPAEPAVPQTRYVEPAEIASKMEQATKPGPDGSDARMWLRALANQDEEAMIAAQKLGVELPSDVYARQPQIREIAGLDRSQKGTIASAVWRDTVSDAAQKLDTQLSGLGAKFTQSGPAITQIADEVKTTLVKQIDDLASQAESAYAQIRQQVPEDARGAASDVLSFIAKRAEPREARPGEGQGTRVLTPLERKIVSTLTPTRETFMDPVTLTQGTRETFPTYATIDDLRKEVGRAIQGAGPFKDEAVGLAKMLYSNLTNDQERISSRFNTADLWKQSKKLVSDRKALEDAATSAFGSEMKNSIAPAIRSAVKGDPNAMAKIVPLLDAVPETLRKETLLTGIADAARATSGRLKGEFGTQQFQDVWRAMRRSKDWPSVAKSLGNETVQTLDAIFKVSKIVSQASGELTGTGASLQKVINERNAAGIMERLLTGNLGRFVGGMSAPGRTLTEFLEGARQKRIETTLNVFKSPEMESLMREVGASGEPSPPVVRRFITSPTFVRFAKEARLPRDIKRQELWLREAIRASSAQPTEEETP